MSSRLRAIARDTVAIAECGVYRTALGDEVHIGDRVAKAVRGTRLYRPEDMVAAPASGRAVPLVEVTAQALSAAPHGLANGMR